MSFNTKFSMWWGSVTTKTEKMFNKEKQRLVTHEYYDNPNAKAARPKSMRSIRGSMRIANSNRGSDADEEPRRRSSSKHSSRSGDEDRAARDPDAPQEAYQDAPQDQYPQDMGGMPQGDPQYQQQMMMNDPQYQQQMMMNDPQYQQQMMNDPQYQQQMMMNDPQYQQQQQMQMQGYPNQGYPNEGYAQGY